MKTIIIDTNAWMAIGEFKIDIFTEIRNSLDFNYKIVILDKIIDELNKIILEQRGKYKQAAKLALSLIKAKNVKIIKTAKDKQNMDVDSLLAELSRQGNLILSQDIGLKRRLQKPYLTIRQKRKVIMIR